MLISLLCTAVVFLFYEYVRLTIKEVVRLTKKTPSEEDNVNQTIFETLDALDRSDVKYFQYNGLDHHIEDYRGASTFYWRCADWFNVDTESQEDVEEFLACLCSKAGVPPTGDIHRAVDMLNETDDDDDMELDDSFDP